jgi:hypothetical protein
VSRACASWGGAREHETLRRAENIYRRALRSTKSSWDPITSKPRPISLTSATRSTDGDGQPIGAALPQGPRNPGKALGPRAFQLDVDYEPAGRCGTSRFDEAEHSSRGHRDQGGPTEPSMPIRPWRSRNSAMFERAGRLRMPSRCTRALAIREGAAGRRPQHCLEPAQHRLRCFSKQSDGAAEPYSVGR